MELAHHRNLAQEFPELKTRILELKLESPAFRSLYAEYQAVDNEVYRIEQEIETPSDWGHKAIPQEEAARRINKYQLTRGNWGTALSFCQAFLRTLPILFMVYARMVRHPVPPSLFAGRQTATTAD